MVRHGIESVRSKDVLTGTLIAFVMAGAGTLLSIFGITGAISAAGVSSVDLANTPIQQVANATTVLAGGEVEDAPTPLELHGTPRVSGLGLVDEAGEPLQLKSASSHGLGWLEAYAGSPALDSLRADTGANSLRLELYTGAEGGQVNGNTLADLLDLVGDGVNAATREGLYAIVDWHVLNDASPLANVDEARDFFSTVSSRYGAQGNVIYEICNESVNTVPWCDVRTYAGDVIGAIRANDPDAVVIVGTPAGIDASEIAAQPLTGTAGENVLYGLDARDGISDGQDLRVRLENAVENELPVFVSDFGDAPNASAEDGSWMALAEQENVSYSQGSLSDRDEAAALVRSGSIDASETDILSSDNFNDSGSWDRACLRDALGLV